MFSDLLRLGLPSLAFSWVVVAVFGTVRRGGDLAAFAAYLTSDTHLKWLLPLSGLVIFVHLCGLAIQHWRRALEEESL